MIQINLLFAVLIVSAACNHGKFVEVNAFHIETDSAVFKRLLQHFFILITRIDSIILEQDDTLTSFFLLLLINGLSSRNILIIIFERICGNLIGRILDLILIFVRNCLVRLISLVCRHRRVLVFALAAAFLLEAVLVAFELVLQVPFATHFMLG